jgi:hypothetical protein
MSGGIQVGEQKDSQDKLTFRLDARDDVVLLVCLSVELGDDLDLLPSGKEIVERNARDSSHLGVVNEAHELVEQSLRKIRILETEASENCQLTRCLSNMQIYSLHRLDEIVNVPLDSRLLIFFCSRPFRSEAR